MKCKTFTSSPSSLETKVNEWLKSYNGEIIINHTSHTYEETHGNVILIIFYSEKK